MSTHDIVALGEPLIEMTRLPELSDGNPVFRQSVGGDTLNALVSAARQGASTAYISAVGGDPFGDEILAFCRTEGVNASHVAVKPQDPTGVNFIHPDPEGRRFSYARRGSAASLYRASDLPVSAIASAKVLHVTAVSQAISVSMREAVRRAAEIARANDTLVSYDLNLRLNLWSLDEAREVIEDFLPLADIVLPSLDEAEALLSTTDQDRILQHFGRHAPRCVALKRGSAGALIDVRNDRYEVAAPDVNALDSTGAGDSFAGAFLAYYLEMSDFRRAAELAVQVAAGTVQGLGATAPIPSRAAILG